MLRLRIELILLTLLSGSLLTKAQVFLPELCVFAEQHCPNSRISFWLYKNNTREQPTLLDPLNPLAQHFEPRLPLKILIHGFIGNRSLTPNLEVRDVLLQSQPVHVVSIDYGSLVRWPCYYPWAVQNAPIVAKCLAQFVDGLLDAGIYTRDHIHLIGFSLGAQVAGMSANYLKRKLKRITGLDPAGPGFMTAWSHEKLDSSDADFVDVIHTDPFFFSLLPPMGHADFYPNLEHFNQLGCSYVSKWRFYNCNHYRAAIYYGESIQSTRGFWSQQCGGWLDFFLHRCSRYSHMSDTQMGYFVSENATGSYFLTTHEEAPFAKGPLIDFEMTVIGV
ncbi:inactive pancreatic lipase-related protein 1 [Scaptodrosophila lebanonensis]|uniref:Inactive pancreatic lipase-related protein 1 n=1 Tax=Drosophila lebanonensis TaxID=7225 RepID=A0A6J2U6K1_DROLE|nr:inactive pancreatic lipase-related protein 1 [Scaptodrosophila lebanonensis]